MILLETVNRNQKPTPTVNMTLKCFRRKTTKTIKKKKNKKGFSLFWAAGVCSVLTGLACIILVLYNTLAAGSGRPSLFVRRTSLWDSRSFPYRGKCATNRLCVQDADEGGGDGLARPPERLRGASVSRTTAHRVCCSRYVVRPTGAVRQMLPGRNRRVPLPVQDFTPSRDTTSYSQMIIIQIFSHKPGCTRV